MRERHSTLFTTMVNQTVTYHSLRRRHALQLFKTDMCKFFFQGRCENGDTCSYAHTDDEMRSKPDLTRTSMCKAMAKNGECKNPYCRFAHTEAELRATHGFFKMKMCGFAQSGRCKHGNSCRFAHTLEELRPAKPPAKDAEDDLLESRRQAARREAKQKQQTGGDSSEARSSSESVPPPPLPHQEIQEQGQAHQEQVLCKSYIFGMEGEPPQASTDGSRQRGGTSFLSLVTKNGLPQNEGGGRSGRQSNNTRVEQQQQSGQKPAQQQAGEPKNEQKQRQHRQQQQQQTRRQRVEDCASSTSWNSQGESSMTEVPQSEHGGTGSPPVTSDSSGGDRSAGNSAQPQYSSGGHQSSSATANASSGETRQKGHANRRPTRSTTSGDQTSQSSSSQRVTTLLVTNVPLYLTQGALLSMFEDLADSMRGTYDFFFCPWDEKLSHNFGYALINFPDPADACRFQQRWTNKELCKGNRGQKALRIVSASMQGLAANLEYFSKVEITPCSDPRFRPLHRNSETKILQPLILNRSDTESSSPEAAPETPSPRGEFNNQRVNPMPDVSDLSKFFPHKTPAAPSMNAEQPPQTNLNPRRQPERAPRVLNGRPMPSRNFSTYGSRRVAQQIRLSGGLVSMGALGQDQSEMQYGIRGAMHREAEPSQGSGMPSAPPSTNMMGYWDMQEDMQQPQQQWQLQPQQHQPQQSQHHRFTAPVQSQEPDRAPQFIPVMVQGMAGMPWFVQDMQQPCGMIGPIHETQYDMGNVVQVAAMTPWPPVFVPNQEGAVPEVYSD